MINNERVTLKFDDYLALLDRNLKVYAIEHQSSTARYRNEFDVWKNEQENSSLINRIFRSYDLEKASKLFDQFIDKLNVDYLEAVNDYKHFQKNNPKPLTIDMPLNKFKLMSENKLYRSGNMSWQFSMYIHGFEF